MKEIQLANNRGTALVDDQDYDLVSKYRWFNNNGYAIANSAMVNGERNKIKMHRLIMNPLSYPYEQIDHINHNTLDNRRENLRIVNNRGNQRNRSKEKIRKTSSKYKGVVWYKFGKQWRGQIGVDYKQIHLGYFKNEIDAAKAYNVAALKYFGGFAKINEEL